MCSHVLILPQHAKRRASLYGAKTAIIEESGKLGGTCVNVGECLSPSGLHALIIHLAQGCVPKKVSFVQGLKPSSR